MHWLVRREERRGSTVGRPIFPVYNNPFAVRVPYASVSSHIWISWSLIVLCLLRIVISNQFVGCHSSLSCVSILLLVLESLTGLDYVRLMVELYCIEHVVGFKGEFLSVDQQIISAQKKPLSCDSLLPLKSDYYSIEIESNSTGSCYPISIVATQ